MPILAFLRSLLCYNREHTPSTSPPTSTISDSWSDSEDYAPPSQKSKQEQSPPTTLQNHQAEKKPDESTAPSTPKLVPFPGTMELEDIPDLNLEDAVVATRCRGFYCPCSLEQD